MGELSYENYDDSYDYPRHGTQYQNFQQYRQVIPHQTLTHQRQKEPDVYDEVINDMSHDMDMKMAKVLMNGLVFAKNLNSQLR